MKVGSKKWNLIKIREKMNIKSLIPFAMLVASNIFMTFAWYGHLKFKESPLWIVILASWGIAFFEYCIQVPANRLGSSYFSVAQLKVAQEVITLTVFAVFSIVYFKEDLKWNYILVFCNIQITKLKFT
jgi:uncharacterized protein